MNFGEKIINLRKQKGLSQEELGYELNVTRQTVSKWELGQTTPEMDKLVELSKIFGVTVDELTSEGEITNSEVTKIEDMPINDKLQSNSSLKVILIIIAVFIIGGIVVYGFIFSKILNFGKVFFNKINDEGKEIVNQVDGFSNIISGKEQENFKKENFNSGFEIYGGTNASVHVKALIDKIITNNKKEKDKIITVIYKGEIITDTEKLKDVKKIFEDSTDYEVSFEYNENGYIYQAEIEEF